MMTATPKKNPLTAHWTDAGLTEGAARRIEQRGRGGEMLRRAAIRRGQRNPVSNRIANYELPESFVSEALPKLEALLRIGHWEQMHALIDTLALECELRAQEAHANGPQNGTLAAMHVTWLMLPTRTTNLMESIGAFTVAALLERFPAKFVGLTQCGPEAVKAISKALVRCNALTPEDAALRVQAWYAAMERRP